MEVDVCRSNVTLKPIEPLSVFEKYRLVPIPASLDKVRGVHPRIYLSKERVAELRKAIKTTHTQLWKEVREQADHAVNHGAPARTSARRSTATAVCQGEWIFTRSSRCF